MKLPFGINLHGKTAVITGAGGVLMSEFARALAACGAKVALLDINAEAVAKVLKENGVDVVTVIGYGESDEYKERFLNRRVVITVAE